MQTETMSDDGTTKAAELKALGHEARVLEMSAEHRKAYEEIRDLLDGQRHVRAMAWYTVGQKVVTVTNSSAYGGKAIANIAKALGRDASLLYDAGRVAETWPRRRFEKLLGRRDKVRGSRLSWSHCVELSSVDDARHRGRLINTALAEGLSVRDLKKQIAGPKPDDSGELCKETDVAKSLRNFKAAQETMAENAPHWKTSVFDVLDPQNEELAAPRMLELLRDVRQTQLRSQQICEDHLAKLDEYINRAEKFVAASKKVTRVEATTTPTAEEPRGRPLDLGGQEVDGNG